MFNEFIIYLYFMNITNEEYNELIKEVNDNG